MSDSDTAAPAVQLRDARLAGLAVLVVFVLARLVRVRRQPGSTRAAAYGAR